MRRILPVLACCLCLTPALRAQYTRNFDTTPLNINGGLNILRHGDQTVISLGGGLLPRRVRVKTATPEGPVVTRFTLPANAHSLQNQPFPPPTSPPPTLPALIRVSIPDHYGIVYIEGQLVRAKTADRLFESPPLLVGVAQPVRLTAVFQVGDSILVEEKTVTLRAGEGTAVAFDGSGAVSVPVPQPVAK